MAAAVLLEADGLRRLGRRVRAELRRPLPVIVLPIAAITSFVATVIALSAAGVGVDGLATTPEALADSIAAQLPEGEAPPDSLPPFPALIALGIGGGIVAGLTINGLFAFGEEYGWRSYLWDRVERWGRVGTIGALGVLWGLWHAPLILLVGLNYPDHRLAGVLMMVVFTTAASWPLDEIRRATGGAVGPAVFHGMINGTAGILLISTIGHQLLAPPAGLIGAIAMVPAGLAVRLTARVLGVEPSDVEQGEGRTQIVSSTSSGM